MRNIRWWIAGLGLLALAEGGVLAALLTRAHWQREAAATPVVRGRAVAERMGCFGCHGPGGERPIPNPGASGGEVPRWGGGVSMMYSQDEADVRAWIRDGHPEGHPPDEGALIRMPAFGDRLTDAELGDLAAYVLAVSQFGWPEDKRVAAGREVAVRFGCFGCHGPEGRGLVANPGSLTGYVPPWDGDDYPELVRGDSELAQWVRNGISDRFRANPAARHLLRAQAIPMPAYGDRISDEELEALGAYIQWVRAHPR
jgi:mono/diheme cytochrome c family protein